MIACGGDIVLYELIESREHQPTPEGDFWTLHFILQGTMDECAAINVVEDLIDGVPQAFQGESRTGYQLRPIGYCTWLIDAEYGYSPLAGSRPGSFGSYTADPPPTPTSASSQAASGTTHITDAVATSWRSPQSADYKLAIEWDGKNVKGIDVLTAQARWTESWKFTIEEIFSEPVQGGFQPYRFIPESESEVYENDWFELEELALYERWVALQGAVHGYDEGWVPTGYNQPDGETPKSNRFREFGAGEIMFEGATLRQIGTVWFQVDFSFLYRRNTWVKLPPTVNMFSLDPAEENKRWREDHNNQTGFEVWKQGHDYMWFGFREQEEAVESDPSRGKVTVAIPRSVYVQQPVMRRPLGYLGVNPQRMADQTGGFGQPSYPTRCTQPVQEFGSLRGQPTDTCGA